MVRETGTSVIALLAGLAFAQAAAAQTAPTSAPADAPAAGPAADADPSRLNEIVVTARKTNESLLDVPLAVTAIGAQQIEAKGLLSVKDLSTFTPGFTVQSQSVGRNDRGFRQFAIRGMIPNSGLATRQSVTLFLDGAPISGGNIAGLEDVERVETVKGPQSAFFGRSTFAGAVNFITRPPSFDWQSTASVSYSTFDTLEATGSLEGPIIQDKLAFRLSLRDYSTAGPYTDYDNPGQRLGAQSTKSMAFALLAKPVENLTLRGYVTYWNDSDGPAANGQFNSANYNCNAGAAKYICGGLGAPPRSSEFFQNYIDPTAMRALQNGTTLWGPGFIEHPGLERDAYQAHVSADYDLPAGYKLNLIGAVDKNTWGFLLAPSLKDTSNAPNPYYGTVPGVLPKYYSLALGNTGDAGETFEMRLTSPGNQFFTWLAGVNYNHEKTDNLTTVFGTTGYLLATPHTINASHTYGVFASGALHLPYNFTLTGEGRYQLDELYQQTQAGSNPTFTGDFRTFTPRVILEYQPRHNLTVYASYSEGNRPGEFNSIYYAQPAYIQAQISKQANVAGVVPGDVVKMEEVGIKGQFFDNRLRILADTYWGRWTNRHIPNYAYYFDNFGAQQSIQVTSAAGIVDLNGYEFEGTFIPVTGLTLDGTFDVASTKNRNTFSTDALLLTGNANPPGTQLPYYPEYSGTASIEYRHQVWGEKHAFVHFDYVYTGKQYESEADLAWTNPSNIFNMRVGLEVERYRFELFGTNIFNDKTPTSLARAQEAYTALPPVTLQAITVSLANPATFGFKVSGKF